MTDNLHKISPPDNSNVDASSTAKKSSAGTGLWICVIILAAYAYSHFYGGSQPSPATRQYSSNPVGDLGKTMNDSQGAINIQRLPGGPLSPNSFVMPGR